MTATDLEHRMPLDDDPLDDNQIATLKAWIEEGGQWPDDGWRPERHWSFEPPTRPALPTAGDAMLHDRDANEIDRFIADRLHEHDLRLNPIAEPARLIRRVYLDVTGLPPSIEEVTALESDPSFEHYVRIVEQLLYSQSYVEKWAVQWLDLARYADSEGYQRDTARPMWPYRDWVINALNSDMPYDQFTIEQLAGDLLPKPSESQLTATAFHRNMFTISGDGNALKLGTLRYSYCW